MAEKVFNAAKEMGSWHPSDAKSSGNYENVFIDGHEYTCNETNLPHRNWTKNEKCAMVDIGDNKLAHANYIGSCMVSTNLELLLPNKENPNKKYACALTPVIAKDLGISDKLPCLQDYVSTTLRGGAFPKFLAKQTLPVAIPVANLIYADDEVHANYEKFFGGMKWEDIIKGVDYLPSVKCATTGSRVGRLFSTKRTIVEITDAISTLAPKVPTV